MQLTAQLGTLTLNNAPLMNTLHEQVSDQIGNGQEPLRALVGISQDEWVGLVREHTDADGNVIIPQTVSGMLADDESPEVAYARTMTRVVEDTYPTPTLLARAGADGFAGAAELSGFLEAHANFEFRDTSVPAYLRANEIDLDGETQQALERVGRVFDLAPRFERETVMQPLLDANLDSAYQIRTLGQRRFVEQFESVLGENRAMEIYHQATKKTAIATTLFSQHASIFNNIGVAAIPGINVSDSFDELLNPPPEYIDFPTWESLFGNIDFCACDHCNSVFSPAAYLVALLKFLRDRGALDDLFARRSDIGHVELNCHNTNTTLPYIDIALEVLETYLVEGGENYQTVGEAPALRVHPEHINVEAYRLLEAEDRVYPWTLPFSLWTAEARAYLSPLGVARHDILNHLNPTAAADRTVDMWLPIASERLNLTPAIRTILFSNAFRIANWNGSSVGVLRTVQTLLDTARISFLDLRQLLGTRFVDPDGLLSIDFAVGNDDDAAIICDLEQARIEQLTGPHLNRIQRFVRLRNALGWQTHELDAVLHALGGTIDAQMLVSLSFVQALYDQLGISLPVLASWVADLDTHDFLNNDDETTRSLYAALFLNRTVGGDAELAPFALDALDGSANIDDHEAAILAALQIITADELALIRERRLENNELTLSNLSELHRVATLKRAFKLSVLELLDLLELSGLDPFSTTSLFDAVQLADLVDQLDAVDFSVAELNYLLRHQIAANSTIAPSDAQIALILDRLRNDLQRVRIDFAAAPDATGELTAQMLAIVLPEDALSTTLTLIYGVAQAADLPADPSVFLDEQLALFVSDGATRATIGSRLLDEGHADYLQPEVEQAERFALVLEPLAAYLRDINSVTLVQQHFADFLDLDLDASGLLLGELIHSVTDANQAASTLFLSDAFVETEEEFSADTFADHFAMIHRLVKVALLIDRFDLPTEDLNWLVAEHATVGWLDLNDLAIAELADTGLRWVQWQRMMQGAILRQAWPAGEPTFFVLLRQAEDGGNEEAFDTFLTVLTERTAWSRTDLDTLLHADRFDLDDFNADWGDTATLDHLWRLHDSFGLLRNLGVSATMAWGWTTTTVTQEIASEVKQAARAKFSESQWLNVAEPIRDGLRQRQRDVLVDVVIQKLAEPLIQDTNDLYAHFLMDAEMNPCMSTSRIVFATASVQLFIQRILLNLEEDVSFTTEDAEMWQWMKNYRVWEANVKVFVTPENWIEPELRPEKSPFFIDLENELLQNDVTLETVEIAYQNYLEKLDEVARLEVVGVYNEVENETLHVIARTKGTPHKYFYRQWLEARRWTPWQEVPVDIEGETVTPVIYNRRLYLFWFTVIVKAEEETSEDGQKPNRYLEIKLAWSQYRQRKWSPKRISDVWVETVRYRDENNVVLQPAAYRPRPVIQPNDDLLIVVERTYNGAGSYLDSDAIQSPSNFLFVNDGQIELIYNPDGHESVDSPIEGATVWSYCTRATINSPLHLRGFNNTWQDVLENVPNAYRVTLPLQDVNYKSSTPIFFEDRNRTYFVTPRHIFTSWYAGPHSWEFPVINVALNAVSLEAQPQVYEILTPVLPAHETDSRHIKAALGSVLHPETHTPAVQAVVSDTIAAVNNRVQLSQPLMVVQGGVPVVGGDVGVPLSGVSRTGNVAQRGTMRAASQPFVTSAAAAYEVEPNRSAVVTYAAEEAHVATGVMTVAEADSIWYPYWPIYRGTEFTFFSFYHPYVDVLTKQLIRYGVDGILNPREHGEAHDLRRQLMQEADNEQFDDNYDLGDAINDADGMLPVEEFDFEYGRAYSAYNWELFFHIPFMIANHLMQNQRFEEAQKWYHYIFDPTDNSDVPLALNHYRFWKVKPFYENTDIQTIEQLLRLLSSSEPADLAMKRRLEDQIEDWRKNPFQPHLIAEQRPVAYQKAIVMKYLDNLIAWGDYLFRRDTRESVFEAIQIYILAAEILGKEPERIPSLQGDLLIDGNPVRTFNDLSPHLDEFGNALVRLETELAGRILSARNASGFNPTDDFSLVTPGGPQPGLDLTVEPPAHEIIGSTLFFCIPPNEKLLGYWDTVADRLFKIRNCQNIEGVMRSLDLFAPPIDPALLVRAAAAGIDLGSVLNNLNAPKPHYRFMVMIGKAIELCNDVKGLGSVLLQALEKRDAEELTLLRQTHEQNLLQAIKLIRERQVDESKEAMEGLKKNLESAEARQQFYTNRNPLIPNEKLHLTKMELSDMFENIAQGYSLVGSALALIPEFDVGAEGGFSSPTVKARFGGSNLSTVLSFYSQMYSFLGSLERQGAQRAQTLAGYDRRQEEWDFSAEQAQIESEGLERQIAAAEIRIAIAEQELSNQELQITQSREIDEFMRYKFTNQQLYSWMITQISGLYFQAYQLAYDMAKRAEKAFQHELADYGASYINFGYWDSLKKGLLAGDRLNLDLRRMETAYYERNKRELELTKHVSLQRLDPAALIQLRETGTCEVEIPEALFNLDFPGHYLRRVKTVSLTIPAVVGPYSSVNATLTLLSNRIRVSTVDPHIPYAGVDDANFITNIGGIQAIATSSGQNDSGLFELNLRDERYLPFEGAGAIGRWRIELNADYRAFDYESISDVVLHLRYTARDGGIAIRQQVVPAIEERINALVNATEHTGLFQFYSLKREFGTELHRFLHPEGAKDHDVTLTVRRDHYPYLFQGRTLTINRAILLLKLRDGSLYDDTQPLAIELTRAGGAPQPADLQSTTNQLGRVPSATYEHVMGDVTEEEVWQLHITPAAIATLPEPLRKTVEIDGADVVRLFAREFEDIGLLINYSVG